MNLQGTTVLHIAQYAAPYEGNFIKSLKCLEEYLIAEGASMVYLFPKQAKFQPWYAAFAEVHKVFTAEPSDRHDIKALLDNLRPAIIHCHFEGYDVTISKAVKQIDGYTPKIVWHLHDWFQYLKHPLKALYMRWRFFEHYCLHAKGVSVIGVCDEIIKFVLRFKQLSGSDFYRKQTILNGIDLNRIHRPEITPKSHAPFTFLTFGGRNTSKRIDVTFAAFQKLFECDPNLPYKLKITEGTDTKLTINALLNGGNLPHWVELIPQTENVSSVFASADCFISASDCETFSYAVCEASIYGLPVIQTNIPGTRWNNENPATFLFSRGNADELAECIKHVAGTYQELTTARQKTRQNNLKYTLDHWANQVINFYQKL
jgi:glycosyltransferase involved in cell wall biosynthesis